MKNNNWSIKDMKEKGLIQVGETFVKASSQVAKKVDKLPNLIERAIEGTQGATYNPNSHLNQRIDPDKLTAIKFSMCVDPYNNVVKDNSALIIRNGDELVASYIGRPKNEVQFPELVEEMVNFYECKGKYEHPFLLPDGSYIDVLYSFDIDPVSAPRMTQSDKWKLDPNHNDHLKRQRKPVEKYFKFKKELLSLCALNGYNLTERLNILFVVPMPDSWSKKKRLEMINKPHKQRPDRDNYLKAFQDAFSGDDGHVWDGRTIKVWGNKGRIIIF